jgi:hypothetical protein
MFRGWQKGPKDGHFINKYVKNQKIFGMWTLI